MKPKSLVLFAVAVSCGLVAMVGAQQLLASRGEQVDKVRVLVARAEVEPGVRLNADLVGFRDLPKDAVPAGAVFKEEQYSDRALKSRAFPGQIIQVAQLGEKGQFGTSLDIPEGMRLVTVPASPTLTHSGIMKPGDRVDVVLTYKMTKKGSPLQSLTKTILEYIQVYAMGDQRMGSEGAETGATPKDVKNVTLLVTPIQAEIMKLAESKGQLHLTLRGVLDKKIVASKGTDEAQLEYLRAELSEDGVISSSSREAEPSLPEPVVGQPKAPTFAEFVNAELPSQEPVAPPEAPKWKMEVFQGDERKVFELELPAAAVEPPAELAPARVSAQKGFWNSPLATWLGGSSRPQTKSTALAD